MKKRFKILITSIMLMGALPSCLNAQSKKATLDQVAGMSYQDMVVNLNLSLSQNWNKRATYFQDGITYAAEVSGDSIVFKVRRYTDEAPQLEPFLIIKVTKEKEQSRVAVWEGEYAQGTYLNLTEQVKKWMKACTKGCRLSS